MGGFGAVKLSFKYPDLFSLVITYAGSFHDLDTVSKKRSTILSSDTIPKAHRLRSHARRGRPFLSKPIASRKLLSPISRNEFVKLVHWWKNARLDRENVSQAVACVSPQPRHRQPNVGGAVENICRTAVTYGRQWKQQCGVSNIPSRLASCR